MSTNKGKVLVTGGAGYIGSHTCVELLAQGDEIVVLDNYSNSNPESLRRMREIVGDDAAQRMHFARVDLRDEAGVRSVFEAHPTISAVVHFAGLKAVGESTTIPLDYYDNNVTGTLVLLRVMKERNVRTLVFSSSATVYGEPSHCPITEDFPLRCTNAYGRTKLFIEEICRDLYASDARWRVILLRYFNPVGAHASGLIGEDPKGKPNNLMPFVAQVAVGRRAKLSVFGGDWDTKDGTGVRDYIHVVDLARGHLAALRKLSALGDGDAGMCAPFNLGTGNGYSVLDMVKAMEAASGKTIAYEVVARRAGDCGVVFADPSHTAAQLGWRAEFGLERMMEDQWRFQSKNPNGYEQPAADDANKA